MKLFIVLSFCLLSSTLWAKSGAEAWKVADSATKVRLLNEYREFYRDWNEETANTLSEFKITNRFSFFLSEAWAAAEMNCIYAGWPSQRVNNFCSSPQKNNPSYDQGNCSSGQMQCQPLLFGKGSCVSVASQKERNLAFTNCDKKFHASQKTSDLVNDIITDGKENELFELMKFADGICKTGTQAQTGMCKRLKNSLVRVNAELTTKKVTKKETTKIIITDPVKKDIPTTTEVVTKIIAATTTIPNPVVDYCPPGITGTPFERPSPREGEVEYVTGKEGKDPSWEDQFKSYKGEKDLRPDGFKMRNIGPNSISSGAPLDPTQKVERSWHFVSSDNSRRETYLWVTDDSGSGLFSHLMDSVIMIVPRNVVPSIEVIGQDLHVILTTGEKVIYDKDTHVIKSGVLSEGKVDMNPDRFQKKFAPIKYNGSGISIRVDKRGEDPRLIPGNATVTQNGKTCQVPAKELWNAQADFKYADDTALVGFLNSKCGKKFSL